MEEKYEVVMWRQERHIGGRTAWAIVDIPEYKKEPRTYGAIEVSESQEELIRIAKHLNVAYAKGVEDAKSTMPPRTIQFEENTWNMLQKVIEAGNRDADTMLSSHPLFKAIEEASKIDPLIHQAFVEAREQAKKSPIKADKFLAAFIKDVYVQAVKDGSVRV